MSISTRQAHLSNIILTDIDTTFTTEVVKQAMEQAGIGGKDATVKHAHTRGMIETTHQKLQTILEINIRADQTQ